MQHCPSCGGILGRDCFNPVECASITNSMLNDQFHTQQLEQENNMLRQLLIDNNIAIPWVENETIEYVKNEKDDLPF